MEMITSTVIDPLVAALQTGPAGSRALAAVTIAVVGSLFVSIILSGYAIWLRVRNHIRAGQWADREDRWTGLTLEAVVGERTVEEIAERVGAGERLPFLDFLQRYARRLTGRERDRVRQLAVPFLPALQPLLEARNVHRRARAVQTLGTLGLAAQAKVLARAVDDESPLVSMLAARALAGQGLSDHAQPILANLDRFEPWGSEYVTSLLVSLGPVAAPDLRRVMVDADRPPRIRSLAVDALRGLHDLDAVEPASKVLEGETNTDIVAALLRLIAVLGGPAQLALVRERLDDPDFAIRAEAYSALGVLGSPEDDPILEEGLEDPSPWVALRTARGIRDRGRVAKLKHVSESDHPGRVAAAQVLAEE